jgi:hypothetical protein
LLGQDLIPLPLPVREPLAVDSFLVAWPVSAPLQSLGLRVIAEIEGAKSDAVALGDTDHDGRNEVFLLAVSLLCNYRIFEHQGNNRYSLEYTGGCLEPYATGDLDGDGKIELIAQSSGYLQVYETPDRDSYPTSLVWSSPYLSNVVGETALGDTDGDGRMEILHSLNTFGTTSVFLIYENRGDNAFSLVFSDTITSQGIEGRKAIADFDRDGRTEIAFAGDQGQLYVYESAADDVWRRSWTGPTGMYVAYAACVGEDTDGNGRDELFLAGGDVGTRRLATSVYEAAGDDSFVQVATLSHLEAATGNPHNATANLDGVGREEYIMDTKIGLWIYRAALPGQWDLVGKLTDPGPDKAHAAVYPFDINKNGRLEVLWVGFPTTLILECRSGVSAAENPDGQPKAGSLAAFPNPSRVEAQLRVSATVEEAARLAVYDVTGRVVERRVLIHDARGQVLWPTRHLPSGVYMLRLESATGQTLAIGRGTVVR